MKKIAAAILLLALFLPCAATAETEVYTLYDEQGHMLTHICGSCDSGDEYITRDNQHYRVQKVDSNAKTAVAELLGPADMPDVGWLNMEDSQPVASIGQKKIALYCTHSDESYIEGDGTESVEGKGGIYDIAHALGSALTDRGVDVTISEETHLPHDAGAYRRSRQTAVELLKSQPNAIFDIHRDGIPDPEEYRTSVGNQEMSMVRLLVGKSNQNNEANMSFAKQIKAVADKIYPGLIKDIYMGKGSYNQDLAPRSVLLEFGTHTLPKELVLKAVPPMSEVIYKALFGGVTGSAGASDVSPKSASKESAKTETEPPTSEDNKGAGWIVWLILALVGGLGVFAFLSTGGRGGMQKWGRSFSEMTGGLFGKKPRRDE